MTRNEHLHWAKERAIKHLEVDDIFHAWSSFSNDMQKHDELKDHMALIMGTMMMLNNFWKTKADCKKFIEGFN